MSSSDKQGGHRDQSALAQKTLDYIISGTEEKQEARRDAVVPVSKALKGEQIVHFASSRAHTRVLFLSSDLADYKDDSWLVDHIEKVGSMFSEVHAAVLSTGTKRVFPSKRLADNMWLYQVDVSSAWFLTQTMDSFAESQLQFAEGFRPDVIVALDPCVAGKAALYLGNTHNRPVQIHVRKDYFDPKYVAADKQNKSDLTVAKQVLKKAKSVRAGSSAIKARLASLFPKIEDLGILPRQVDSQALLTAKRSEVLKQKYPQYVFFILAAGVLDHDNTMFRILDAARSLLFSPRIGLVIVGDGPMRAELAERAKILEITEQVIFEPNMALLPEYLLSADMFVTADTTPTADERVIHAAAAGLPMVMARTPLREDLFEDGKAGLLCDAEDVICFNQKMNSILNTNAYRVQFGVNARAVIKDRLHTDPEMYKAAYRDSIEVVFSDAESPAAQHRAAKTSTVAPDSTE